MDNVCSGELIRRYFDETANEEEVRELERLVSESAAVAGDFAAASRMEALLAWRFTQPWPTTESEFSQRTARRPLRERKTSIAPLASYAALSLLAAAALVLLFWSPRTDDGRTLYHKVVSGQVMVDGVAAGRVPENALVRVTGPAPAGLRLVDGSYMQLAPESEAVIRGSADDAWRVVELLWGSGSFCVHDVDGRFRVETPVGSITALGEKFSVELQPWDNQGDETMSSRIIAALALAVSTGAVQVDIQGTTHHVFFGERQVFAADKPTKDKTPSPPSGDMLGFTMKGNPAALEKIFPGINAALLLSEEQMKKLHAARAETTGSDAARDAGKLLKSEPNATEAQREAAKKTLNELRGELQNKVRVILTAEQQTLVQKLNDTSVEVHKKVRETLESEFNAAKGNDEAKKEVYEKYRKQLQEEFNTQIVQVLSPAQLESMKKAAEAQKAAAENPDKGKK